MIQFKQIAVVVAGLPAMLRTRLHRWTKSCGQVALQAGEIRISAQADPPAAENTDIINFGKFYLFLFCASLRLWQLITHCMPRMARRSKPAEGFY